MPLPSSRRMRPVLDHLEVVAAPSGILPSHGLVDLRSTTIITDLRNDLLLSTPHDGRQGWSVALIKGAPSTGVVYGSVRLLYRAKPMGFLSTSYSSRVKLHVDIAFAAPLDDPEPRDVVVSVSRSLPGFGPNVRATMALGIVAFLKHDHDTIANELGS